MQVSTSPAAPARRTRRRRVLAAAGLGLLALVLGAELGLRWVLFSGAELPPELSGRLRQAWRYADPDSDAHWILRERFTPPERRSVLATRDELLGWTGRDIAPGTRVHAQEASLDGRRPILLYGDSFAQCTTPPEDCFQGLVERSELGNRWRLLNFGVGGHGFDQTYLMLRETLPRLAEHEPFVVIGIFVDDGLERMLLTRRPWPKPRLRTEEGALVVEPPAPVDSGTEPAGAPAGITSYLWRRSLYGSRLVPAGLRDRLCGRPAKRAEKQALAFAVLRELRAELESRGLEHCVLLFHGPQAIAVPSYEASEPFLLETLRALQMPFVSSRRVLEEDLARTGARWSEYFGSGDRGAGHYSARGNAVVLRALRAALEGRYDP